MWQALAAFAVRGPAQAALLSLVLLVVSLSVPPLVVISNAIVALVWLRLGPKQGLISVAIALAVGSLIAGFSGNILVPATLMMSFWLPVILMAFVLRKTVSLDLAVLAGGMLALAGVLATYIFLDQPSQVWQGMIEAIMEATRQASGQTAASDNETVKAWLSGAGTWMTGFSAATQFVMATASLLLARVWQARMFNPGGLQKEFHELRFGRIAGVAGIALIAVSMFFPFELLTNLTIVVTAVFAFQGLAVIHALVAQRGLPGLVLVGLYLFLLIMAPTSIKLIAALGLVDTWVDCRRRFGVSKKD